MRWLAIAHQIPGRTRLRTPVLRHDPPACERLADALAAIAGVHEVGIRPYTGSALVEHDALLPVERLVECARDTLAIERVLAEGERPPIPDDVPRFSSIARKLAIAFQDLDRDLRRGSEGIVDLGMLATLGCFGAGAAEVVASRKLPLPPWFNLAWWGVRLFMTAEQDEINASGEPG